MYNLNSQPRIFALVLTFAFVFAYSAGVLFDSTAVTAACPVFLQGADSDDDQSKVKSDAATKKETTKRTKSTPLSFSKQDADFVDTFRPVVGSVTASTVKVLGGRRQIAIGSIVDSDGYILTKASEMRGVLKCKLPDGKSYDAVVVGVDKESDFALLKIDADGLPTVSISNDPPPVMGKWLVTPLANKDDITVGIVAVNAREIPPSRPFIGIQMEDLEDEAGVRITSVVPDSPANDADLQDKDVILKIDDINVMNIVSIQETLGQFSPEQVVTITLRRGETELKKKLVLADKARASPDSMRSNSQNRMGSSLSRRSKDFSLAFQHDSMLQANQCGGPIVDLSGKVVGFNIARAGRVSSLALPAAGVNELVEKLKSGEFAPEIVNREKITSQALKIAEMEKSLTEEQAKQSDYDEKLKIEAARIDELTRMQKEITARLDKMKKSQKKAAKSRDEVRSKTRKQDRSLKMMRHQLESLKTGRRY